MNSDQMTLFLRVAATGNLSRTAMETGISQSAFSRRISALEKELHTRLFHRSGRGVRLTQSGERLEKYAIQVSALLDTATREMSESLRQGPSSIIIAAPPTIARLIFGTLGKTLKRDYPGIRVHFKEGLGGDIQEWLGTGEIDAAVVYLPPHHPSLKVDLLIRDSMHFVAPMSFGPIGDSFPVERLADVPLVMPTWPNGLRILADTLMASHSRTLNVSMECDASVGITKQLVMEGCGCTILSMASVQDEVMRGLLQAAPLAHPDVYRDVAIVTPKNRPPILKLRQIIETVREVIFALVKNGLWGNATIVR